MTATLSDPKANAFITKHASCLEQIRKEYWRQAHEERVECSFQEFVTRLEEDMTREVGRLKNPKAIDFAEKNAAELPVVFLQYRLDNRSGAVRLMFEHYLLNIAIPKHAANELARRS